MNHYSQRLTTFFLSSIQQLRNESGVQRWYDLCEDVSIIFSEFQTATNFNLFTIDTFKAFLLGENDFQGLYIKDIFQDAIQHVEFQEFMFIALHALLDPPSSWWHKIQTMYHSSSKDKHCS